MQNILGDGQKRNTIKENNTMEKSLLDKIHNGTTDEIDKEMIMARCKNATIKFIDAFSECLDRMSDIADEYEDELRLVGLSCVMLVQTKMFHKNDGESDSTYVFGKSSNIEPMLEHIKGELK